MEHRRAITLLPDFVLKGQARVFGDRFSRNSAGLQQGTAIGMSCRFQRPERETS